MNVVIVGDFWFPFGTASAARVRNLALGLRECGARVHVISLAPFPRTSGSSDRTGTASTRASPTSAPPPPWRPPTAGGTRTTPCRACATGCPTRSAGSPASTGPPRFAWQRLRQRITRGECDLVVAYERSALRATPLVRLCRAHGVTSVLDVTEVERAPGQPAEPALLGLARRHALDAAPLRRPHRDQRRPGGALPRRRIPAGAGRPGPRGLVRRGAAAAHAPPRVPSHLRGRAPAARRAGAAVGQRAPAGRARLPGRSWTWSATTRARRAARRSPAGAPRILCPVAARSASWAR